MKKSIGFNTIFNVAYKLLNIIFPLITSAYLARILGPSNIGRVDYARNIMSYFLVVASMGIPTYGMREIAKARNDSVSKNQVFSELFLLNGLFSILCSAVYIICIMTIGKFKSDIYLYICTGLTLFMNVINIDWVYSGDEEYVYISTRSFLIKLISVFCIIIFIKDKNEYIQYALILSLATTGNYLLNVLNLGKHVKLTLSNINIKKHLRPTFILFATLLASDLYNQIDVTMLGIHHDNAVVGYYSNGIKLVRIVYSITLTIGATILPRMCLYYKEKNTSEYNRLFWRTFWIIILCASPCVVGLFMVADDAVRILFGDQFLPTISIIRILTPIILIISISYLIGSVVLTSTGNEKYLLKATVSGAITNIALNAILIPRYSTTGAAIASIAGELVVLSVHFAYGRKYIEGKVNLREILKLLLAIVIMGICVKVVEYVISNMLLRVMVSVLLGFICYVAVLFVTKHEIISFLLKKHEV